MYMGVKNHHTLPRVTSYEDAQRALAVWESKTRRGKQVTQVLSHGSAIAFRLYETDVVTWEADNSVHVDNYGTTTTSSFAHQFLPAGIHLHYPVERRGCSGGSNTIGFRAHPDGTPLSWQERYHVCQGAVVRFTEQDGVWLPDEDTCYDITLPKGVERKKSRELAKTYHFAEFESWLQMGPLILGDVEHSEWDLQECMDALEKRDWRQAAMFMPTIKESGSFGHEQRAKPLPISCEHGHYISLGCLAKLKLAIWDWHGFLIVDTAKTWPRGEFDRRMQRVKEMEALGLNTHGMGPLI